ncbi:GTPase HflX [Clostridium sp. W14A]|uniref:GTPase HflX n=1 Tax=Caproicibacter fermentans TaxID=2576756 RepID=A0A7G8T6R6_9FIRM|nr:GTPase HflX [Caproicibacter fermentans]OCN01760.1 GTPase HflX [Clostridium sp. W14A]QNK39307.1 GTPase HflX [Caproicibacter fermentans]
MHENKEKLERALLVEVDTGGYDAQASLAELYELTRSAGAQPFGAMTQKRPSQDAATCVGSGMMRQIAEFVQKYELNLLIFDCELTPTQIRNIERESGVRAVDRTMLILDIFASRAQSREGKLQVELAQLKYLLPRLGGRGSELSRLGGGIGTRGPGESKLETDRRHIRRRIDSLTAQIHDVEMHRRQISRRRKKDGFVTVAMVGYTNAGKSTLMNALTGAGVPAEDMLFCTLDPTARALRLPGGETVLLIDTVGLVRRLPHHLVRAFRSTLEQAAEADIILNVCDASSPEAPAHLDVAKSLLSELGCGDRPVIPVLNKCDLIPDLGEIPMIGHAVRISAKTGEGLNQLLQTIEDNLEAPSMRVRLLLPFTESGLEAEIRKNGSVESEEYTENGFMLTANIPPDLSGALSKYIIE